MAEPFLSEIRIFSFNFAPKGWALCNGQFLPINQNQALFALLGTTYGGNGQTTFALPNLRGRLPIHFGNGRTLGESGGATAVVLNVQQLPPHTHQLLSQQAVQPATAAAQNPAGRVFAGAQVYAQGGNSLPASPYGPPSNLTAMAPNAVSSVGGSQAHNNMAPSLVLNFCIALQGIFPSQN